MNKIDVVHIFVTAFVKHINIYESHNYFEKNVMFKVNAYLALKMLRNLKSFTPKILISSRYLPYSPVQITELAAGGGGGRCVSVEWWVQQAT